MGREESRETWGPVDPTLQPQPVADTERPATITLMASGWWPPVERITQAYGLCFTEGGLVVVVRPEFHGWNLPGGTVEPGEHPSDTLVREISEEACARVVRSRYLASQHIWDPGAPEGNRSYYQARFWARIELEPWAPRFEMIERRLVLPGDVASTLFWRDKAIIGRLVELAVAAEIGDR